MSHQDRTPPDRVICAGHALTRAGRRLLVPPLLGFLIASCVSITEPPKSGNVLDPVVAKVKVGNACGASFHALLDGVDVTSQFSPASPSSVVTEASFSGLASGMHTLTASAGVQHWLFFSYCATASDTTTFNVNRDTPYMADCRANGVPIPPDWAETDTAWVHQGNLNTNGGGTNLLQGATDAHVWTYTDPNVRGACVALPRGAGDPGSLAGIICQSATTGKACFWDNQLKSDPTSVLGWRGQKLVISDLVDGTNFAAGGNVGGPCARCHSGDNVFLMSPDDPTWAKVLRGPLNGGPSGGKFTTQVDSGRYTPLPVAAGWTNSVAAGGNCGAGCHELPPANIRSMRDSVNDIPPLNRMPMRPACGSGSGCYGTP
ncbi:hypothetical protein [Rhizobacter sp. Root1221]|uniref:hypothetical protein n=1 Tax=Rhizobacter sp. Root1221 TaxID=1736433 RepID=UPI000A87718A|nr:hypothetical protein [Rhizobacter sp. Root1221]